VRTPLTLPHPPPPLSTHHTPLVLLQNSNGTVVPYYTSDIFVSYDGITFETYDTGLPNVLVPDQDTGDRALWPGMVAADWDTMYIFGDQTFPDPNSIFRLPTYSFYKGWEEMPYPAYTANPAARSRYTFLAGAAAPAGCWFATDYNAGAVWGLPNENTSSTNAFYTSFDLTSWRVGPVAAPWGARAGAGITQSADRRSAWLVGGMEFQDGSAVYGGATFSDAWAIDASVCLYGDNGQVCSGIDYGYADLDTVECTCTPPYIGQFCGGCTPGSAGPYCEACAPCVNGACKGNGTITGDGSCVCQPGWVGPDCSTPSGGASASNSPSASNTPSTSATPTTSATVGSVPTSPSASATPTPTRSRTRTRTPPPAGASGSPSTTPLPPYNPNPENGAAVTTSKPPLSPGATGAIVSFALLGALGLGVYVYATYFGGGAVVAGVLGALAKPFAGLGGSGGGSVETRGLLKPGVAKGTLSAEQAASRLGGAQTAFAASSGTGSGAVSTANPIKGAGTYQSF
jgi:hypothetical protein